jgi:hypothetical protein
VGDGIGTALTAEAMLGDNAEQVFDDVRHAFVDGWHQSMWIAVGIAAVLLVYIVFRGPQRGELALDSELAN